jgi:type IV pilus assembly protein PilA
MTTHPGRRGFTYVEVLAVLAMSGILAAIAIPNYLRAQKKAQASEAVTNLKSLHAAMSAQLTFPTSIHVPGFNPPRGNKYSYILGDGCWSYEDRSMLYAIQNDSDVCIGADTFANPTFPSLFYPVQASAVVWDANGTSNGMFGGSPGVYGTETNWDYLAYAAGQNDGDVYDAADTWLISSADGELAATCPAGNPVLVPAGTPFQTHNDANCY